MTYYHDRDERIKQEYKKLQELNPDCCMKTLIIALSQMNWGNEQPNYLSYNSIRRIVYKKSP